MRPRTEPPLRSDPHAHPQPPPPPQPPSQSSQLDSNNSSPPNWKPYTQNQFNNHQPPQHQVSYNQIPNQRLPPPPPDQRFIPNDNNNNNNYQQQQQQRIPYHTRQPSNPNQSPQIQSQIQPQVQQIQQVQGQPPNKNWTQLIPPMPSRPQPSYSTSSSSIRHDSNDTFNFSPSNISSNTTNSSKDTKNDDLPPQSQIQSQSHHKSKAKKFCNKCGLEITAQFVRAMQKAFHLECFVCDECGNECSSKFFTFDKIDPKTGLKIQVPLCDYDYFKNLDLICFDCNQGIRGRYITALGHKYHVEHFRCATDNRVFDAVETYIEHEDNVYCHFHYSKLFAAHCPACNSSVVKQYVELYRGGKKQQWHPECYMIYKFYNVCITAESVGLQTLYNIKQEDIPNIYNEEFNFDSNQFLSIEQQIENVVMKSWLTLCNYEETTASCISDMLLKANLSDQVNGLITTGKLIVNVEILFNAVDYILKFCESSNLPPQPQPQPQIQSQLPSAQQFDDSESSINALEQDYFQPLKKEARNISGKIMSYLAILRKSSKLSKSGSLSGELLSVITGLAHYLKLLIRIGLNNALKLNKLQGSTEATDTFLKLISNPFELESQNLSLMISKLSIPAKCSDACFTCTKSIEKSCIKFEKHRWHLHCFKCSNCSKNIPVSELNRSGINSKNLNIYCQECQSFTDNLVKGKFELVSDLSQLIYLLKIALSRSKAVMKIDFNKSSGSSQSQPSQQQQNYNNYATSQEPQQQQQFLQPPQPVKPVDEQSTSQEDTELNYSNTLSNIKRLKSRRESQKLSNSLKQNARKSIILDAPEAEYARPDEISNNTSSTDEYISENGRKQSTTSEKSYEISSSENLSIKKAMKIRTDSSPNNNNNNNNHLVRTSDLLKNEQSLTLDDIPRIVAAEQARDQRPNAFKHHRSLYQKPQVNTKSSPLINPSHALDNILNSPVNKEEPVKRIKYYSELSKDEHFIMRHISVEALLQLNATKFNKDELLSYIQLKKQSNFWDKFKFGGGNGNGNNKKDIVGVFGVELKDLTKKYGIDSDLGVGPSKLRIPIVVDDIINALKQKDMSVEGIYRLNGNIKKLKLLIEQINKNPLRSPDFSIQTAVQLAALMKRWLRDLPNPLLTFNLYELWISSQREVNPVIKNRILQLTYCLLPRSNRNLVEVLLYFFNWVASFAEIDEETGSKMDTHNLATVIAPNILYAKSVQTNGGVNGSNGSNPNVAVLDLNNPQSGDTYFLAIEVVNQLIETHEELSIIPEDILKFYDKCGFSNLIDTNNISSKEIMNKIEKTLREDVNFFEINLLKQQQQNNKEPSKQEVKRLVSKNSSSMAPSSSTKVEIQGDSTVDNQILFNQSEAPSINP
ncbi:hypothetical protein DFJ63DRAFT_321022 [Scheffersomyces coipomensis]|uniref:uncharacterized protein n=1 Tax=Scheffersomyces coipomensis TaxID=1788519 RepID=UPI00315CA5FA